MSKSKIEWISDRTPKATDGDEHGFVLTGDGFQRWDQVISDELWIHSPQRPRTGEDVIEDMINHTYHANIPGSVPGNEWYNRLQNLREELRKFYASKGETK